MKSNSYWLNLQERRSYQQIFVDAHGEGPWKCYFCEKLVYRFALRGKWSGCVHHIDENRENNSSDNLAAAHLGCHSSFHNSGKVLSEVHRDKISKAHKGKKLSEEHRKKIGDFFRGRKVPERLSPLPPTDEARRNMSESAKRGWEKRRSHY